MGTLYTANLINRTRLSLALEVLDIFFMLLSGCPGLKSTQVAAFLGFGINFSGIKPVFSSF
jgi:hypothetical protein